MAGLRVHLEHGPETYLCSGNIVGGTFVEPDTANPGYVKATAANSAVVMGLAIGDAVGLTPPDRNSVDAWGRPNVNLGLYPPNEVAVAYRGSWWLKNTTGGTLAFGARVYAGANGALAASGTGPVVGIVISPKGIANGDEGKIRLTIR